MDERRRWCQGGTAGKVRSDDKAGAGDEASRRGAHEPRRGRVKMD